jgi:hypothetical protein
MCAFNVNKTKCCSDAEFSFGSISEIVTLEFLCSGVERQAELIFTQIVGVFISQFGQEQKSTPFW